MYSHRLFLFLLLSVSMQATAAALSDDEEELLAPGDLEAVSENVEDDGEDEAGCV